MRREIYFLIISFSLIIIGVFFLGYNIINQNNRLEFVGDAIYLKNSGYQFGFSKDELMNLAKEPVLPGFKARQKELIRRVEAL